MVWTHAVLTHCFQAQQVACVLGSFHPSHRDTSLGVCLGCSMKHSAENIFGIIRLCEILIFHMLLANFTAVM